MIHILMIQANAGMEEDIKTATWIFTLFLMAANGGTFFHLRLLKNMLKNSINWLEIPTIYKSQIYFLKKPSQFVLIVNLLINQFLLLE